jgi:AraC-like DNA-binding protein
MEGEEIFSHDIIPDGFPEIIFHYGEHYYTHKANGKRKQAVAIAAGQLTKPITISPSGKTGALGVKFKPPGIWKLFGLNMQLIANETESLEQVINFENALQSRILEAQNNHDRIQLLDRFFLSHLDEHQRNPSAGIIHDMVMARGQLTVKKISDTHNISPRKLERTFNESIGVSAKMYLRLMRFDHVYKLLQQNRATKADIAFLGGYFDQSHFNRDFKIFTGEDPSTYFKNVPFMSDFFLNS